MTQNEQKKVIKEPALCLKCQQMFGNPIFDDMCSTCFKKQKSLCQDQQKTNQGKFKQSHSIEDMKSEDEQYLSMKRQRDPPKKLQPQKCNICKKKIGILGYQCKHCTASFCKLHRLPQDHSCDVDFITLGKKKLKLQNPMIGKQKIQKI